MKLLFCPHCKDVFRLYISEVPRRCLCGRTCGRYVDTWLAQHNGFGVPLILASPDLRAAIIGAMRSNPGKINNLSRQVRFGTAAPDFINWEIEPGLGATPSKEEKVALAKLLSKVKTFKIPGI
jgi:hypothetical protein